MNIGLDDPYTQGAAHTEPYVHAMPFSSFEIDNRIRGSWKEKKVVLWDEGMTQSIGEGVILYVFPYDFINFEQLGDDCVGVGIEKNK